MSQRLLISKHENINLVEDNFYDCIFTEYSSYMNLLADWCNYDFFTGIHFGPWKIYIRDNDFMDKFNEEFKKLSYFIPELTTYDDIWEICEKDKGVVHRSEEIDQHFGKIVKTLASHIDPKSETQTK